jgi:hypothetical protein
MSRTILLRSGGSIDLKMNNSLSLDKECEMKAVKTETQIINTTAMNDRKSSYNTGAIFQQITAKNEPLFPMRQN